MNELPYAEDIKVYWKTSVSVPAIWTNRAKELIEKLGGEVLLEAIGKEPDTGREALLMIFEIEGDRFKVVWPVLDVRRKANAKAARIQAATMMHHDIKAKCVSAKVIGARAAFFQYLMLPDGRAAVEASVPELQTGIPSLFATNQLETGNDFVKGNFTEG
jgi:hypothetical protein